MGSHTIIKALSSTAFVSAVMAVCCTVPSTVLAEPTTRPATNPRVYVDEKGQALAFAQKFTAAMQAGNVGDLLSDSLDTDFALHAMFADQWDSFSESDRAQARPQLLALLKTLYASPELNPAYHSATSAPPSVTPVVPPIYSARTRVRTIDGHNLTIICVLAYEDGRWRIRDFGPEIRMLSHLSLQIGPLTPGMTPATLLAITEARAHAKIIDLRRKAGTLKPDDADPYATIRTLAETGNVDAEYELGTAYETGRGVAVDRAQAYKWYRKAAEQGHPNAQAAIALRLTKGTQQEVIEGLKLAAQAAEKGDMSALSLLTQALHRKMSREATLLKSRTPADAQVLADLNRLPIDELRKKADAGDAKAMLVLTHVCRDLDTSEAAEALKWLQLAAERGDVGAQYELGSCYTYGVPMAKDLDSGLRWFKASAEGGYAPAQLQLYYMLSSKDYPARNPVKDVGWLTRAAELGLPEAQLQLGEMYEKGYGIANDAQQAVDWYRKAVAAGSADAGYNLSMCYQAGRGVARDDAQADLYLEMAAEGDSSLAQTALALRYDAGIRTPKDRTKALMWAMLARYGGMDTPERIRMRPTEQPQAHYDAVQWLYAQALKFQTASAPSGSTAHK